MRDHNLIEEQDTAMMLAEKGLGYDVETLTLFLENIGLPYAEERVFNQIIREELMAAGIPFKTNVPFGQKNVINFLIADHVALFCSVNASVSSIVRKIELYSKNPKVDSIIVVTSRNISIGDRVLGKEISIIRPF
ncbi:MAG: hypothetical protein NTX25_24240 [Proteobacteria bacterium]|nr:hypothetical protein [Pseudomonadota bacterium]